MSGRTVALLRRDLARRLATASDSAALDARLILAHVLGLDAAAIILSDDAAVSEAQAAEAEQLAARRAAGEPVARILGGKEFYGLSFVLSRATLVPRPDTETLVDAVLEDCAASVLPAPLRILDLGTGSGAILVALLVHLPQASGVGVDRAGEAVRTARANGSRHGVAERATFRVGNWLEGIDGVFPVIVSNPPYIAENEMAALPVDVRDHDPHLALVGGADGLAAYRAIIPALDARLARKGRAYLEIGAGQAGAVEHLAGEEGFRCRFRRDLAGIERVAILERRSETVAKPPFAGRG